MAVSLDELTAGVLESSLGPWAVVVGAGTLAVALGLRTSRPPERMTTCGLLAVGRAEHLRPRRWLDRLTAGWRALVAEARAEYLAERAAPATAVRQTTAGPVGGAPPTAVAGASLPDAPSPLVTAIPRATAVPDSASRRRDERGRFIPRSTNGTQAQ